MTPLPLVRPGPNAPVPDDRPPSNIIPNGEVTDVKIVKGLGSGLDEETMRAIKTLPRFVPGKQNGREVSVAFTVPVTYRIQ